MKIRKAVKDDLPRMQGSLEPYLDEIIVAEDVVQDKGQFTGVVGYYHYLPIPVDHEGLERAMELLRCAKQFPGRLVQEAFRKSGKLCVCMQGASHREVFTEFIKYFQERYSEIWCYCSVKSRRSETYKKLGFIFGPEEEVTFFNFTKGDFSTYRLGRWPTASDQDTKEATELGVPEDWGTRILQNVKGRDKE